MRIRVTIRTPRGDLRGLLEVDEADPLGQLDALGRAAAVIDGIVVVSDS